MNKDEAVGLDGNMTEDEPTGLGGKIKDKGAGPDGNVIEDKPAGLNGNMNEDKPAGLDGDVIKDEPAGQDGNMTEDEPAGLDGNMTEDSPAGLGGNMIEDEPAGLDGDVNKDEHENPRNTSTYAALRKAGKEVVTGRPPLLRAKTKGKEGAKPNGNGYKGPVFTNREGRMKIEEERLAVHLKKLKAEDTIEKRKPAEPVDSILNIDI